MDLMINDVLNDAVSNDVSASSGAAATADTPITPPEKKRPGRPKKRIMTEAIKISGVVEVPNDPESKVSKLFKNDRNYHLLEELHTLPSVGYLNKVRNVEKGKSREEKHG